MNIVSWNVNGIKSCTEKGLFDFIKSNDIDIVCLQEIKTSNVNTRLEISHYSQYYNPAKKKGYAGTAVFSKREANFIDLNFEDEEGRVILIEYEKFFLINYYSPFSGRDLSRLAFRMDFDEKIRNLLEKLSVSKPVILCGDLNVAYSDIDLKNPKLNFGHAGFTESERESFSKTLKLGFFDTFRKLYPDKKDVYTWWSYRKGVREKNIGWRIDYILASENLRDKVVSSTVYSNIFGSDHCPIGVKVNF